MNCTAPFCKRCGVYGHDGKDCSLPCRRCGDPHATVACTIRQSYSEAASKNFPPLQPETPAKNEREDLSTPAPVTCQDQAVQIATLRETPTVSPASPDPAVPEGNEDPHSASRPTVIPMEPQVEPPLNKAPLGEHVAEVDETSDAHHMAAESAESSPVIEETPSRDDDVSDIQQRLRSPQQRQKSPAGFNAAPEAPRLRWVAWP
ncbi:hypothetical protein HPB52_014931 [Rhipicephalus sanguineus]|uniref:CCHC-type domain-containing protein n=1 Tax=Rhipicephalus sanguineus TaxID=34632 RepID=A0A9D4SRK3_RHISA|nr:hypothetical protein HPB52_014931 [Rhipicephalus sanguineus]